jgi:photosystem II stability/assembly factor-like uncharacterized protein
MIRRNLASLALLSGLATLAIAAWAALAPADDWKIAGPFGGTATSVALDPQNPSALLAGAMNSLLFESDNAGASWKLLDFPKRTLSQVTSILVDPSDSKHYLVGMTAAEGGGLFESHDAGQSWSVVREIADFGVRALAAAPSNPSRFVAGTLHGVMLSDDCGAGWKRISDPHNVDMEGITSVAFDPKDPNIIYAGTAHLPWKTTDAGKTWQSIHDGMIDDSDVFSIYVDPTAPNNILASACSGIYSSTDRGELWRKLLGIPNTSRRTHVVREDPTNSNIIYAGTTTGLFKSFNGGKLWKTVTNTPVNALAFNPATPYTMYLALEDEGIGKSNDQGEVIELVDTGFVDRQITAVTSAGKKLLALEGQEGESSGLFVSTNQGETWTQLRSTRGLAGVHLKAITGVSGDDRTLLASSAREMYKSVDGGLLWKPLPIRRIFPPPPESAKPKTETRTRPGAHGPTARRPVRPVKPKPVIKEISVAEISGLYSLNRGARDLLFAATDLGLLVSDDLGEHWLLADIPAAPAVLTLYADPAEGRLIVKTSAGLYSSNDFGDHWSEMSFPLKSGDVNDVALLPADSATLLAATRVGLYRSADGGANWSLDQKGLPVSTVSAVAYSAAQHCTYAVQYGKLYQLSDGNQSWSLLPTALPTLRIRQLWIPDAASTRLYGITSDLGILFRN